jgi:hypothetical protein
MSKQDWVKQTFQCNGSLKKARIIPLICLNAVLTAILEVQITAEDDSHQSKTTACWHKFVVIYLVLADSSVTKLLTYINSKKTRNLERIRNVWRTELI